MGNLVHNWDVSNKHFLDRPLEGLGSLADDDSSTSKRLSQEILHRVYRLGYFLARPHQLAIDLREVWCSRR